MGAWNYSVWDAIAGNAASFRDRAAFIAGERRITHGQFAEDVARLATGLAAIGLRRGERLAIVGRNSVEYATLFGAAARLGAIVVPINWRLTREEIQRVLADATPAVLVAGMEFLGLVDRQNLPFVRSYFAIEGGEGAYRPFADLLAAGASLPATDVTADDGFILLYTAAVDGHPRGALLTQAGVLTANLTLAARWSLGPTDVTLGALPLFHLAGVSLMFATFVSGGASVIMPAFDAEAAAGAIEEHQVTVMSSFSPMMTALLDKADAAKHRLSSLRVIGGLETPETITRLEAAIPGARFWAGYGQAEISGYATLGRFSDRPGAAGRTNPIHVVAVVDDLDRVLPAGQSGEIVVRGPTVFKGYWRRDQDNAFTLRNGWHHTGDLGHFDADGYLWFEGRSPAKELIKSGGENVYPAEVEEALRRHPSVADAVVFGVPDPEWGEAIKAVCSCKPERRVSPEELIEFVAGRIARYKRPRRVIVVDALPRTATGAPDRARIKQEHTRS
jgi:acyl-CoA synthetase (AMP-forming)/AMP-acid ligase II